MTLTGQAGMRAMRTLWVRGETIGLKSQVDLGSVPPS